MPPDAEVNELAAAIAGEANPTIVEKPDSAGPDGKPASKGEGQDASTSLGEGNVTGEAESKEQKPEGEGGQEGGEVDPLKGLDLKALLEHPQLGPLLNSWADRAGAAQVAAALERERESIRSQAELTVDERHQDEHFSGMSREDIAAEIASDEKAALAYAEYEERRQAASEPNPDAIAAASQVYAYATRVASVSRVINDSELSVEAKAELAPENFTHLGTEGIVVWEKAVFEAMVSHEAGQHAQRLLDEKWETYQQEKLAEGDETATAPTAAGRRTTNLPGLIETPSEVLLEDALTRGSKPGNK